MRLIQARVQNWAIRSRNWNYEGAKVTSSTANSRGLNGANATTGWPVILGGRCMEDTVKNAKDG